MTEPNRYLRQEDITTGTNKYDTAMLAFHWVMYVPNKVK